MIFHAEWNGIGVGQPKGGMAISWRGCKIFEASPTSEKLARINKIAVVFEGGADEWCHDYFQLCLAC